MVVIDATNKLALNLQNVATRDVDTVGVAVPSAMSGTKHVYAFYYNALNNQVSASVKLPTA